MNFEDPAAARFLVKSIDVLRDHLNRGGLEEHLQQRDALVAGVRACRRKAPFHLLVPCPDPFRVAVETVQTGDRHRVNIGPQAVAGIPEGRDAAFSGKSGTRKKDDAF